MDIPTIESVLATLDDIERQLQEQVTVSTGFMSEYYDLRSHIDLVQDRLQKRHAQLKQAEEATVGATTA
jgi:hypothetical protein